MDQGLIRKFLLLSILAGLIVGGCSALFAREDNESSGSAEQAAAGIANAVAAEMVDTSVAMSSPIAATKIIITPTPKPTEEGPTPTSTSTEEPTAEPTATTPPTSTATATPSPTSTPSTYAVVTTQRSRLRSGPGTDYDLVTVVDAGTQLFVLNDDNVEWLELDSGNWIAAFLVEPDPSAPTPAAREDESDASVVIVTSDEMTTTLLTSPGQIADIEINIDELIDVVTTTGTISGTVEPTPIPLTRGGNPVLTDEEKGRAIESMLQVPIVKDAIILQDEGTVTLIVGLKEATDAEAAQQIGDGFLRLVKTFSGIEPDPRRDVGEGYYSYLIFITTADGEEIAFGYKDRGDTEITW
jgi:hypothetical protein